MSWFTELILAIGLFCIIGVALIGLFAIFSSIRPDRNKETAMPNKNCLEGIRCPECDQDDNFKIVGKAWFDVTDDGTSEFTDVEWDDDSACRCPDCGFTATLLHFREPENSPSMG
jgi:DNA-directed RNA polymerase subunit RPC12/RpoP